MGAILSLEQISLAYGPIPALRDISLRVHDGELLGILGPNGSGKSTLLKLMCGLLSPTAGEVRIKDTPLKVLARAEIARRIAMVAQESHFRFSFSVEEVVLMGRFPHQGRIQFEGRHDLEVAHQALRTTRCLELTGRSIHQLSGGEKQRVLIARALAQEPGLLLFDEPTSFLDLRFKREIFQLMQTLARDKGMGIVVVTHDLDLAAQYCSRIAMLKKGAIYAQGEPTEVITATNIDSVFECPVEVEINPITRKPRVNVL
jgi:iron complex transport system ATP-binding protein